MVVPTSVGRGGGRDVHIFTIAIFQIHPAQVQFLQNEWPCRVGSTVPASMVRKFSLS